MGTDITNRVMRVKLDEISEFLEGINLFLTGFGQWNETDVKSLEHFTLSCFQLTYIHQGCTKIITGDRECICTAGSVFLLEPFRVYSAYSIGEDKLKYTYLLFDITPYSMRSRFEAMTIQRGVGVYVGQGIEQFGIMMSSMHNQFQTDTLGRYSIIKLAVLRVIIHMMRVTQVKEQAPQINKDSNYSKIVDEAILYTEEHLNKPIHIYELAHQIGVSESTLYKAFMHVFSLSPSKVLTQYKIKKGEQLIMSKQFTIEEISELLGYSSASHFSRTFKSILGRRIRFS